MQFANEEDNSDRSIEISEEQNLTSKQISKAMCLIDEAMEIFLKNDPDSGRSFKVSQTVATNINCYKEIYFTLKKNCSANIEPFFCEKADLRQQPLWTHQTVIIFYFIFINEMNISFCFNCICI